MRKFYEGEQVKYVPQHANGNPDHPACESGTVSKVKDMPDGTQLVWVRYSLGETGALTPTKNLI